MTVLPPADLPPVAAPASVIGVVGAGWLGRPLAEALRADGHRVLVSTTTPARAAHLTAAGLDAFVGRLEPGAPPAPWSQFLQPADALVVSLPPQTRHAPDPAAAYAAYAARLLSLARALPGTAVRHVVLLSSTAVYPDHPGAPLLTEAAADPAHPLAQAEAALAAALPAGVALTVARLGGLMGPGRAPGQFFGPGRPVPQPAAPVNMLHLTDAIGSLRALLFAGPRLGSDVFSVCAAGHPARAIFYAAAAEASGRPAPPLAVSAGAVVGKQVSSAHLRALTGYVFQYDDPLAALLAC